MYRFPGGAARPAWPARPPTTPRRSRSGRACGRHGYLAEPNLGRVPVDPCGAHTTQPHVRRRCLRAPAKRCFAASPHRRARAVAPQNSASRARCGATARRFQRLEAWGWRIACLCGACLILSLTRACGPQIGSFAAFLFGFGAFPRSSGARAPVCAFPVLLAQMFLRYLMPRSKCHHPTRALTASTPPFLACRHRQ